MSKNKEFTIGFKTLTSSVIFTVLLTLTLSIVVNRFLFSQNTTIASLPNVETVANEQVLVNLLKEINVQSQQRLNDQMSFYSWTTGSLALVTGFFTIVLLYISFVGWSEYERVRAQREKIDGMIKDQEKLLSEKKDELKEFVRHNVRDLVDYSAANVFFRLDRFELANETVPKQIEGGNDIFLKDVGLLRGKINYKLGLWNDAITCYQELEKYKRIDIFEFNDLMGAAYKKGYKELSDPELLIKARCYFEKALSGAANEYDRQRIWLNMQAINLWQNNNDEVIKIYDDQFKGHINGKPSNEIEKRLIVGVYVNTIYAYWKSSHFDLSLSLLTSLERLFADDADMTTYLSNKFNIDHTDLEKIMSMYQVHKSNVPKTHKTRSKNGR